MIVWPCQLTAWNEGQAAYSEFQYKSPSTAFPIRHHLVRWDTSPACRFLLLLQP
jgi:hypothetical protein